VLGLRCVRPAVVAPGPTGSVSSPSLSIPLYPSLSLSLSSLSLIESESRFIDLMRKKILSTLACPYLTLHLPLLHPDPLYLFLTASASSSRFLIVLTKFLDSTD